MNTLREIVRRSWRRPLVLFVSAGLIGCAAVEDPTDGDGSGESTDSARTFESVGGTAGLSMGSADNGAAVLSALDPGAFLLAPSTTADSSDDAIAPVQVEGGGDPPPPPPPDGGSGDAPPPDGGDGTVPPPDGGDGTVPPPDGGDGTVPPPDGGDGTVPPPDGGDGTVPPPDGGGDVPPPPDGFEEFPDDFTFTDEFQEFFEGDPDASGTDAMHFEDLAFDEFFEIHTLDDLFTGLPPEFNDDHFGFFEFGNVPPPPEGFPEFPPPPDFEGLTGDFTPFEFDFDAPPPDDFPEEFFEFAEKLDDLHAFLEDFPVGEPFDGEPSDGLNPLDAPPFDFIDFDEIADFLPEGFLPPEEALAFFTDFGGDHPLIGEEGAVNPELEAAFFERPPIPEGFDGFDFDGDCPQFDDIFTLYDDENIGETMRGQVNTTRTGELPDGSTVNCGDTTVLETVQGQATPLVELEPGVYETQWVVSVRQLTTSRFKVVDPTATEPDQDFEQSTEILGEVQWIVIIKEVDVDGDGIPDETHVHGQSSFETFTENVTGTAPDGLAEPPPLILPFEYEAVLESTGAE